MFDIHGWMQDIQNFHSITLLIMSINNNVAADRINQIRRRNIRPAAPGIGVFCDMLQGLKDIG